MRHLIKHLDLFDKFFIVLFTVLAIVSAFAGDWRGVLYLSIFVVFIFLLAAKDMRYSHLDQFNDHLLETVTELLKALGGKKIVKTTTIEFEVVKSKKEGNRGKKERVPKSKGSKKGAKSEATGTASVSERKSKTSKKNSEEK